MLSLLLQEKDRMRFCYLTSPQAFLKTPHLYLFKTPHPNPLLKERGFPKTKHSSQKTFGRCFPFSFRRRIG